MLSRLASWATASSSFALMLGCAVEPEAASDTASGTAGDTGEFSCDAIAGEGYDIGQVSMNWTLADADGQPHSLYEFCGRPIYMEDTAPW